jgi:outer membrane lipopolysaccharide assembly protein LptE/RlpB
MILMACFSLTGCGYHRIGAATHISANVRTLAVPIFHSKVQAYNTETAFTQAIVRELNTRTNYRVLTAVSNHVEPTQQPADATLVGTILTQSVTPLTYDASSGQTSSYLVTITASVELVGHDGAVLYRNPGFAWREQYQSTQDLSGFVQEDSAAVRRMAHDFAQSLVSDMLESFQ